VRDADDSDRIIDSERDGDRPIEGDSFIPRSRLADRFGFARQHLIEANNGSFNRVSAGQIRPHEGIGEFVESRVPSDHSVHRNSRNFASTSAAVNHLPVLGSARRRNSSSEIKIGGACSGVNLPMIFPSGPRTTTPSAAAESSAARRLSEIVIDMSFSGSELRRLDQFG